MSFSPPELRDYQVTAKDFIVGTPRCAVYLGMGMGKTLTTLSALYEIRPPGNILVVAPLNIARSTWLDEIADHGFPLRTVSLIVDENDKRLSRKKRYELYESIESSPPAMYFINQHLLADLVGFFNPKGVPKSIHPDMAKSRPPRFPFETLIIDEAQIISSPKATITRTVAYVSHAVSRVIELTGTPVTEGYLKIWSQIYPLDHGARLGSRFTQFRDTFFHSTMLSPQGYPIGFELNRGAGEVIRSRLSDITMSAQVDNPLIPETKVIDISITLSKKDMKTYKEFAKEAVVDILTEAGLNPDTASEGDIAQIAAANAAVLNNKLLQMASGTLYASDEEIAEQELESKTINIHDEKIDMLETLLAENEGQPVIIAHTFVSDREKIHSRFAEQGCEIFDGSREMTKRWNNKEIPILLIHPQSAGHGINLQHGGNILIWYTLPYSGQQYQQTNARLARMGQKERNVRIYRLLTKGTIDEDQPLRLEGKYTSEQMFLDALNRAESITP